MTTLKICIAALTSALASAFITVWLMHDVKIDRPTLPPLVFSEDGEDQVIWGAWQTVQGYDAPGIHSTEIRCNKARMSCVEGLGTLLIHDEGQDLESQVFEYRVSEWGDSGITATAVTQMSGCLQRRLAIQLKDQTASLSWKPQETCEDGDTGRAILVGDPL
jgi:hypothetical protein